MGVDPIELVTNSNNRGVRIQYARENVLAALDELHEALNEFAWKSWAKSDHFNSDAFFDELIDLWHFVMNLALVSGVHDTPYAVAAAFVERYYRKRQRNAQRQAEGYDGVTGKCPKCKRAYDDESVECHPARKVSERVNARAYCAQEEAYF
jgi:hypothetical protein